MVLICANAFGRYALHAPIIWAEEVLGYGLVWMVYLGAVLVTASDQNLRMDLIVQMLGEKAQIVLRLLGNAVFIAVALLIIYQAPLTISEFSHHSQVANLPMDVVHYRHPVLRRHCPLPGGSVRPGHPDIDARRRHGNLRYTSMIWAMVLFPIILLMMGMPIFTVLMAAASVARSLSWICRSASSRRNCSAAPTTTTSSPFRFSCWRARSCPRAAFRTAGELGAVAVRRHARQPGPDDGRRLHGVQRDFRLERRDRRCDRPDALSGAAGEGYPVAVASGFLAASAAIDVVIPPSIAMILYGVAAEESIRYLFIGGILPGLLMALLMALYIYFTARRLGIREGGKFSVANVISTTRRGGWALGMPIIILGGIYTGVFSPTEAAGVACLYAIVVALFIHRDLTWAGPLEGHDRVRDPDRPGASDRRRRGAVCAPSHHRGRPAGHRRMDRSLQLSPIMVMLMINLLLLAVGCVVDPASAILVLAPILKPIAVQAGIDPVHFGVVMTVNLSIGMFTPPFGLNIFIIQGMFKVPLPTLYRGLVPVIGVNLVALAIISAWPGLTLWLVRLMG